MRELQEQTRSTRKQMSVDVVRAAKQGPRQRTKTESRIKCKQKIGKTHITVKETRDTMLEIWLFCLFLLSIHFYK